MLSNTDIAELLSQYAERETGILSRAFRRAARSAFLWPEHVTNLVEQHRSLTELRGIGPFIEEQIRRWIDKPPQLRKRCPAIRQDFISLAEVKQLLAIKPEWQKNCAAICKCILMGAMGRALSPKWPMRRSSDHMNTSQSLIILKV